MTEKPFTTTFSPAWFTPERVASILNSAVSGSAGSQERIQLIEFLRERGVSGFDVTGIHDEVKIPTAWLRAWAVGAIAGWSEDKVMTRFGPMPLTDGDRNLLRTSCKALKVWEYVCTKLPAIQEDKAFATDQFTDEDIESIDSLIEKAGD